MRKVMKKVQKICMMVLVLALVLTGLPLTSGTYASAAKKKMKLSKKKITLQVGKKKKLTVKNKKGKVKWKTSKKKVATVSKKGVVKAKRAGKATITASVKYKKKTKKLKCKVTVIKKKKPATKKPGTKKPATKKPATNKPTIKSTVKPTGVPSGVYEVRGTLKSGTGACVAGETIEFREKAGAKRYEVTTGAGGAYSIKVPEGEYTIHWNELKVDSITVEKKAATHTIEAKNMYKVSGTLYRNEQAWTNCEMNFSFSSTNSDTAELLVKTDKATGAWSIYLPKNKDFSIDIDGYKFGSQEWMWGITDDVKKDIRLSLVKVTGTIYESETTPWAEENFTMSNGEESYDFRTDSKGKYQVYVAPDAKYQCTYGDYEIGTLTVENEDIMGKDFTMENALTRVFGKLTAMNGDALADEKIFFYNEAGEHTSTTTGDLGEYFIYLPKGNYTITIGDTRYELSQKLTVDEKALEYPIKAPFYKVSGTVYNNSEKLTEKWLHFEPEGGWDIEMDEGGVFRTSEDGNYSIYLPVGKWNVYLDDNTKKSFEVTGDMTQDFHFSYYVAEGHLYRTQGVAFEDEFEMDGSLQVVDAEGSEVAQLDYSKKEYRIYLPKTGTYEVQYNGSTLDTIVVSGTKTTYDIVCNLYLISGNVTGLRGESASTPLIFKDENENEIWANCLQRVNNGRIPYSIVLLAGNYTASYDGGEEKQVTVTADNDSVDITAPATYKVSGTVSRKGTPWTDAAGTDIWFNGEYNNVSSSINAEGKYEVYLKPGEYQIDIGTGIPSLGTVTVQNQDIEKDISLNLVKVSGKLTRYGKPESTTLYIERTDEESISFPVDSDSQGMYTAWLEPSATYQFKYSYTGIVVGNVTTGSDDITKDINVEFTRYAGTVKGADGRGVAGEDLQFYSSDESSPITTRLGADGDDGGAGTYFVYLPKAVYTVKINGATILENLTIGEEDTEKFDIETSLYKVSGTVSNSSASSADESICVWIYDSSGMRISDFWHYPSFEEGYTQYLADGTYYFVIANDTTMNQNFDEIDEKYKKQVVVNGSNVTQDLNY